MARDTRNNGHLDLLLERTIDAPRSLIWKAWTDPEHVKEWWGGGARRTGKCEAEFRSGGVGAGALDNVAVRIGSAPGRDVSGRDAVTRGSGISPCRLLPRAH
jgi:uncharacterized protein YndB with AHSA1/START domain